MSAWMFLPFAFGAFSFISVSVFKKIRENKCVESNEFNIDQIKSLREKAIKENRVIVTAVQQKSAEKIETGIPSIDKNILSTGIVSSVPQSIPHEYKNPVFGEITLPKAKHIHNEYSVVSNGNNLVSTFKLKHKPVLETICGTVYFGNNTLDSIVVATFCAQSNGQRTITVPLQLSKVDNYMQLELHWGYCDNHGTVFLEWAVPNRQGSKRWSIGNNYIVVSYDCAEIEAPINPVTWQNIKSDLKYKETIKQPDRDDFFIPEDGNNTVRLLPPLNSFSYASSRQHYYTSDDGSRVATQCGKKLEDGKWVGECPICDHHNKIWKEYGSAPLAKKESVAKSARAIKPIERYYYNVLVDNKVKIFSCGKSVHDQIVKAICGDQINGVSGYGDITNPATGRNITLNKKIIKTSLMSFPDYKVVVHKDATPIGTESEVRSIMEKTSDLKKVVECWQKTPEELNAALQKIVGNDSVSYNNWKARNRSDEEVNQKIISAMTSAMDVAKNMQHTLPQNMDEMKKDLVVDDISKHWGVGNRHSSTEFYW